MLHYETLVLANSHVTKDELTFLDRYMDELTAKFKGKFSLFDNWGKQRLAYPIEKGDYGVYVLLRYELPKEVIRDFFKELEAFFKLKYNEVALRHVTIKLDGKRGVEYQKPEPVSSRAGHLDSFIKEHKIDKFLDSKSDKNSEEAAEASKDADKEAQNSEVE